MCQYIRLTSRPAQGLSVGSPVAGQALAPMSTSTTA
jgi:hypothetical protein